MRNIDRRIAEIPRAARSFGIDIPAGCSGQEAASIVRKNAAEGDQVAIALLHIFPLHFAWVDRCSQPPAFFRTESPYVYVTEWQLARDTLSLIPHLPADADAVIGIARSGMLPAAILSCYLHLPLYAVSEDGFRPCGSGIRARFPLKQPTRAVLVDDSGWNGTSMRGAEGVVRAACPGITLCRAAVYARTESLVVIDVAAVRLDDYHFFAWNLFNSHNTTRIASDLDGVICGPGGEPLQIPRRVPLAAIVSGRPEHDRPGTVAWLARWGIRYRELVMGPWPTCPDESTIAQWKAGWYAAHAGPADLMLFIESEPGQARMIAQQTGQMVLCPQVGGIVRG